MGKPILLVEDDRDIRESLTDFLEVEGHRVVGVPNGEEALARLRTMERPALVLLDLMMPVMDGRTFLAHLRGDAQLASLPVIVLTADPRDPPEGVAAILPKPFSFDVLRELMARHGEG